MKKLGKNNKGFSLVELIVVVLIMAIIAVALAPQVMKWVDNSRIATDRQTADSVVSFAQLALTNKAANTELTTSAKDITITVDKDGYKIESAGTCTAFVTAFCDNAGIADAATATTIKLKSSNTVVVTVSADGVVTSDAATSLESDDLD